MNTTQLPVSQNNVSNNDALVSNLEALVVTQTGVICEKTKRQFHLRDKQAVPVWDPKKKINQRFLFCWFFQAHVAAFADERLVLKNEEIENVPFTDIDPTSPYRFEELGNISGSYRITGSRYPGFGIAREGTPALACSKEYVHYKMQVEDVVQILGKPVMSEEVEPSFYAEVSKQDALFKAWNPVENGWTYLEPFEFPHGPTLHDWDSMAKLRNVHAVALARQYQDKVQAYLSNMPGRVFYGFPAELDDTISDDARGFIVDTAHEPVLRVKLPSFMSGSARPAYPIDSRDQESLFNLAGATASEIVNWAEVNNLPSNRTWPKRKKAGIPTMNPTIPSMVSRKP